MRGSWLVFAFVLPAACGDGGVGRASAIATLSGAICDDATKLFVPEASVTLIERDPKGTILSQQDTETDQEGKFEFRRVASGTHLLRAEKDTFVYTAEVVVRGTKDTELPVPACLLPSGAITGRICDDKSGEWVSGASVYVVGPNGAVNAAAPSDANGAFSLSGVPSGPRQVIADKDGYKYAVPVMVRANGTVDLGINDCVKAGRSNIEGQICANAPGLWLAGAKVSTKGPGGVYTAQTDAEGRFLLKGLEPASYQVEVDKGAFHLQFDVTTEASKATHLDGPKCTAPDLPIAVISGNYDSMQKVMRRLQFASVTVFKGYDHHDPIADLPADRSDADWSGVLLDGASPEIFDYKIAMINSGADSAGLGSYNSEQYQRRLDTLRRYVSAGNYLYVSDNAFSFILSSFGAPLSFYGATTTDGCLGTQRATPYLAAVEDPLLASRLGAATLDVYFPLPQWCVLSQLGPGVKTYLRADVAISGLNDPQAMDAPLLVSFHVGKGRVIFSSLQTKNQPAPQMDKLMDYLVFEL